MGKSGHFPQGKPAVLFFFWKSKPNSFTHHPLPTQCNVQLISMLGRFQVVIGHHHYHHVCRIQQLKLWCPSPWALLRCQKLHRYIHRFLVPQEHAQDGGMMQTALRKTDDNSLGFDGCHVICLLRLCFRSWSDGAIAVKSETLMEIMSPPLISDWGNISFLWWLQNTVDWYYFKSTTFTATFKMEVVLSKSSLFSYHAHFK